MEYSVFITRTLQREISKLSISEQNKIQKLFNELVKNPYTGKPLKYKFFREKRLKEKLIYYLVYDDQLIVLAVAISGKKNQQATIDHIIKYLPEYKKYVKSIKD